MSPNLIVFLVLTPLAVAFAVRQLWARYDSKSRRRNLESTLFRLQQHLENTESQVKIHQEKEKSSYSPTPCSFMELPLDNHTRRRQRWQRRSFRLRQQIEEVEEAIAQLKQRDDDASRKEAAAATVVRGSDGDDLKFNHTISMKEVHNGIGNE